MSSLKSIPAVRLWIEIKIDYLLYIKMIKYMEIVLGY